MSKYSVSYFYLATGMEGRADVEDYGVFEADSKAEAVEKAIERKHENADPNLKSWERGCLTATEVKS